MTDWISLLRVGHYGWPTMFEVTEVDIAEMVNSFTGGVFIFRSFDEADERFASALGRVASVEVQTDRHGLHLAAHYAWAPPQSEPAMPDVPADGSLSTSCLVVPAFTRGPSPVTGRPNARLTVCAISSNPLRRYSPTTGEVLPL